MQKIIFNLPKVVSANAIYAGKHWTSRNRHKNLFREVTFVAQKIYKPPVSMHYHFKLKKKRGNIRDNSNLFYMAKLIEDSIIKKGILPDDDRRYVNLISISSEIYEGDDVCEITIEQAT